MGVNIYRIDIVSVDDDNYSTVRVYFSVIIVLVQDHYLYNVNEVKLYFYRRVFCIRDYVNVVYTHLDISN